MKYKVEVSQNAARNLERLPKPYITKIYTKILSLRDNPRPSGCKKLKGYANFWRIRIGVYRVIYSIEEEIKIVEVRKVLHGKDAY